MCRAWLVLPALFSMACGGEARDGGGENGSASSGGTAGSSTGGLAGVSTGGTAGVSTGGAGGVSSGGVSGTSGASSGGTGGSGQAGTSGGSAGSGGSGGRGGSGGIPPDVGSGQCQEFTPCGGSVTGVWNYTGCTDPELQFQSLNCSVIDESVTVLGEIEFKTDGTMIGSGFIRSQATLGASCTCGLPSGFLFACTAGAGGTCICDSTDNPTENSTYTTNGNVLISVRNGITSHIYYCRQGDELWMRGVNQQGLTFVYHLTPQ